MKSNLASEDELGKGGRERGKEYYRKKGKNFAKTQRVKKRDQIFFKKQNLIPKGAVTRDETPEELGEVL